jgi:hypothetical protein
VSSGLPTLEAHQMRAGTGRAFPWQRSESARLLHECDDVHTQMATGGLVMADPRIGRIVADHNALRREATELLVLAEHGREVDRALGSALVDRLSGLCERPRIHFALEEQGGYMRDVVIRRPGLWARVVGLLEALRRHEASEYDLIQQAFLDEFGSGD